MDFSWVKQLADTANQNEAERQERIRKEKEDKKTVALATCPFVEKLHVVISGATEEYNKHCRYPHLRVNASKLYKHSKTGDESTAEPDEVAYFTFQRTSTMYGIRGMNGLVEFLQLPVSDTATSIRLHEYGTTPMKSLQAQLEPDSRKIRWSLNGAPVDGPAIVSLCQKFFIDLIEQTSAEIE